MLHHVDMGNILFRKVELSHEDLVAYYLSGHYSNATSEVAALTFNGARIGAACVIRDSTPRNLISRFSTQYRTSAYFSSS